MLIRLMPYAHRNNDRFTLESSDEGIGEDPASADNNDDEDNENDGKESNLNMGK